MQPFSRILRGKGKRINALKSMLREATEYDMYITVIVKNFDGPNRKESDDLIVTENLENTQKGGL